MLKIYDEGADKLAKIWCVDGDDFAEVNAYYLTYEQAIKMANELLDEGEFEICAVYVGLQC